ncbi:MAG TPA: hypothetical protein VGM88_26560 [Kofleriaceae bacterium]|jgi:hypothetical protein
MQISWLSAAEIAAARAALSAGDATWEAHFSPAFDVPPEPEQAQLLDWPGVTEHVARAERVSAVVREHGLDAARARFAATATAIEAATLAAAAHEGDDLTLDQVIAVLTAPIDEYVFYAPFLELLVSVGKGDARVLPAYEHFANAYTATMVHVPGGSARIGAVRDGLADFYVSAGKLDEAEALFSQRHDEDLGDVAVALTASRAFLAARAISHAVRWLGIAAARAQHLGRAEQAEKLRQKQEAIRKRLS